ncbi:hypothetical protein IFM89_026993 [Coptis chinensis]|uniref:DUF629 domain-containing protein n=1 Tax=Coptis chinensis TaxID=261450 RepID=A0A835I3T7_9MAGN|nr:hypothetical protein IFM89_026993 [Coptis chinensis]
MEKNHIEVLSMNGGYIQSLALDRYWKVAIKGRTWTPINISATLPIVEAQWNSELRKSNPWEWATTEKWPVSDEHERKDSLELIQKLLQGPNLAAEHMDMVIEYTMKNIEDLHPGLRDKFHQVSLDKTQFCIYMLGASELDTVHEFFKELQELYKNNSAICKIPIPITMDLIEGRILLNGDSLCLLFGKNSLQGGSTSGTYTKKSSHIDKNASSATYAPEIDDSVPPNGDVGNNSEREINVSTIGTGSLRVADLIVSRRECFDCKKFQILVRNTLLPNGQLIAQLAKGEVSLLAADIKDKLAAAISLSNKC